MSNIRVQARDDGLLEARVNWATFYTRFGETSYFTAAPATGWRSMATAG